MKTEEDLNRLKTEYPTDEEYWSKGFEEDWINMMDCEALTPSGSQTPTADDISWERQNGLEFNFLLTAEPVRYLRFWIEETWGSGADCTYVMIGELQFFGEIQK